MKPSVAALLVAFGALPAAAQDWDWRVTPYVWGSSIEGDIAIGPLGRDVDVSFSDLLNVLSGTLLLHVEAANDDHLLFGDLVWLAVEPDDEIATVGGEAEAELDATIIEAGYARASSSFGWEVGLRYWDLDMEIDPARAPALMRGDSWIDGFAGFRNTRAFGADWTLTTRGNLGLGGSDLSVGFQLDFARELERGNAFVAGLKLLTLDYEAESVRGVPLGLDAAFFGATVGFTFD